MKTGDRKTKKEIPKLKSLGTEIKKKSTRGANHAYLSWDVKESVNLKINQSRSSSMKRRYLRK